MRAWLLRWLGQDVLLIKLVEAEGKLAKLREEHDRLVLAAGQHRGALLEHKCWMEALIRLTTQSGSARERELHRLFSERVAEYRRAREETTAEH